MSPDILNKTNDLFYKEEAYSIVGAAMAVHRELGCGFLEAVYHEALLIELKLRDIPFQSEVELPIVYRGHQLKKKYCADIICYDKIVIELKAVNHLDISFQSQVLNYLKATGFKLGLLINFGEESLKYQRIVY